MSASNCPTVDSLMKPEASHLDYAGPQVRKLGVLSATAIVLAILSLAVPGVNAWMLWKDYGNAVSTQIGVNPAYYGFPLASIVCAILGMRNRSKIVPLAAIVLSVIAAASTWYITSRSW